MRVISQNRKNDFPYENGTVFFCEAAGRNIIKIKISGDDALGVLGEYSTREKAIKAMEMLREAYIGMPIVMQNVAISEDVAKEFERLKKCGIMVRTENQPSKVDFINNSIFQFPQDNEIEV